MAALQDLINSIYGGDKAQGYLPAIDQGYANLQQPAHDPNTGREGKTSEFITNLASTFADQYQAKNGQLPSADEVQKYVAQTATPTNAQKFILGNLNTDQMGLLASNYGLTPATAANTAGINPIVSQTQSELNNIYGPLQTEAVRQVNSQFAPLRSRAADEEAALGRLRSGVSAAPTSSIGQVDASQGNALSSVIGNILGQKASGTLDLTKYNQGLDLSKQSLAQAQNQFNQSMGLTQEKYQNDLNLQNQQLALSKLLGQQQADASKPGTLDYLNTAFNGLSGLGNLFAGFGNAKSAYKK